MPRDSYTEFANTGIGRRLTKTLGLPQPAVLRRYAPEAPRTPTHIFDMLVPLGISSMRSFVCSS